MEARRPAVAVIGGGFSGAMVAVQLIRQAAGPFDLHVFEPGEIGQGVAYGTVDPEHLLNVPASRMGALAGAPGDFLGWLSSPASADARATLCPGHAFSPGDFAPRRLYAAYVSALFAEAVREASGKGIAVVHHRQETRGIVASGKSLVVLLEDTILEVERAVLAIGNLQDPREETSFPGLPEGSPIVLPNAWEKEGQGRLAMAASRSTERTVIFILGTGLTTVDTILTLERLGYRGSYRLLSRGGHLPLPHAASDPQPWTSPPTRLLPLMQALRHTARNDNWRSAVDGLRPHTMRLWQGLPLAEKRYFLHRLFTLWNIHRHRMAPQIAMRLDSLIADGRLIIASGRLAGVEARGRRLSVEYRTGGETRGFDADYAIACIGPGYDVEKNGHPLLTRLLMEGIVQPHALRSGLAATGYRLGGKAADLLFGIGTILIGERLETTAVPELREQAAEVAAELWKSLEKGR